MDKKQFSDKKLQILSKYQKIHKMLFRYWIFFLIAIFSFIKLYAIFSTEGSNTIIKDPLQAQKDIKIKDFFKKIQSIDQQTTLTWSIALWEFKETEEYIESFNNLLYYKGFVIPRFFWISKTAPIQDIEYFNKWTYDIEELDTLFKNVFIWSNKNAKQPTKNISFPIPRWIIEEFNLQCVFQSKISSIICDIFINNFLEKFFIHTIETDIQAFSDIMNLLLQKRKYNQKACEYMIYYIYYTEKENTTIENLLQQCDPKFQEKYRLFVDFSETQKELFSKFISNKIYKDEIINIYKLISFQQIINDDINNKIINVDRLNWYFWLLQEILKREKISTFYKELTYFFNNYYIKRAIQDTEITNKIANKADIDSISKQVTTINNGNPLIWFPWLKDEINKNIIEQDIIITWENIDENYEQKIDNLLEQIKDLDIKQKFISWNNILIYWIREIETTTNSYSMETQKINIATKLRLEENSNTLTLKQITLEEYEDISQTINKLITNQERSFADLKKYIYQNSFLFTNNNINSINEEEIISICKSLTDSLPNQEIKICNNNRIDINTLRKNKIITITITHDNFLLNKIDVSDQEAKAILNEYLKNPDIESQINYSKITKTEFVEFVNNIIEWFLVFTPQTTTNYEWSANTMIILERVKKYLWIQVNDIVEKNEKILIDFTIVWIPFLWYYNIKEHKITPIYFKEANSTKTPVLIKNLILTLTDDNKSFLSMFLLQPLEIIKQYSPEEYLLYQKFISEK